MPQTNTHHTPTRWIADTSGKLGSRNRVIRNHYAYRVLLAMTGGQAVCPTCPTDNPTPFSAGSFEVDRTHGAETVNGRNAYTEGRCVYVCKSCNQGRALLQGAGRDWTHADAYAADVAAASASVTVGTYAAAAEWWQGRAGSEYRASRYA